MFDIRVYTYICHCVRYCCLSLISDLAFVLGGGISLTLRWAFTFVAAVVLLVLAYVSSRRRGSMLMLIIMLLVW